MPKTLVVMELRAPHEISGDTRTERKQIETGQDNSRFSSHHGSASLCTWVTRPEFVQPHISAPGASFRPLDRVALLRSGKCGLCIDVLMLPDELATRLILIEAGGSYSSSKILMVSQRSTDTSQIVGYDCFSPGSSFFLTATVVAI